MRGKLGCAADLELPRDVWVVCDLPVAHVGKHSGWHDGRRYWWWAVHARARSFVPRQRAGGQN